MFTAPPISILNPKAQLAIIKIKTGNRWSVHNEKKAKTSAVVTPIKKLMPIEEATTKADEEGLPRVLAQAVSETQINVSQVEA